MLNTQEHIEIIEMFDRENKGKRLDKEHKSLWKMGRIYQDGNLNELFLSYRKGYALAKSIGIQRGWD